MCMNRLESHKNFRHWNAPFHPMERTVSMPETLRMPVFDKSLTYQ